MKERIEIRSKDENLKKIKKQTAREKKARSHFSEVVVVTCGDYRVAAFIRKYLKRMYKCWEMDILTSAGGSRVISFYDIKETDELFARMKTKEQALWIDFTTYLTHNAKICVLADHNACGMWPPFGSEEEEDEAHIMSLLRSKAIILKKYPSLKKILLIYLIIHPLTHIPIKVKLIDDEGNIETIIIKKVRKLCISKPLTSQTKRKKKIDSRN